MNRLSRLRGYEQVLQPQLELLYLAVCLFHGQGHCALQSEIHELPLPPGLAGHF